MSPWPYTESELDPVIHAEILIESARAEARTAILVLLLALGFGVWHGFGSDIFGNIALFAVLAVLPMLIDSWLRRRASEKMRGIGPQPK